MKKINLILIVLLLVLFSSTLYAGDGADINVTDLNVTTNQETVNVYFFGTSTCPYCQDEKAFFTEYAKVNPDVKIYYFQLDKIRDNSKFLLEFSKAFEERSTSVPITFISDKVWIGFSESIQNQMTGIIDFCRENECKDSFNYLENQEGNEKYLTDDKYFKILGKEEIKKEKIGFFKRIANFFKNLF